MGVREFFEDLSWYHYAIAAGVLLAIVVAVFAAVLTVRNRRRRQASVTWNDIAALEARGKPNDDAATDAASSAAMQLYQEPGQPPAEVMVSMPSSATVQEPPPLPLAESSTIGAQANEILQ